MNRRSVISPPADIFVEFLEVAVHIILHARKLYPDTIFKCFRKYGVPVHMSIHPQVNEYINECMKAAQFLIKQNELQKLVICIFNPDKAPIQRYIFDVLKFSTVETGDDPFFIVGEQSFRAFCLRVAALEAEVQPLPPESTFTIQLLTNETSSISLNQAVELQNFPWMQMDATFGVIDRPSVVPICTIDTEYLILQMYTEETTENID